MFVCHLDPIFLSTVGDHFSVFCPCPAFISLFYGNTYPSVTPLLSVHVDQVWIYDPIRIIFLSGHSDWVRVYSPVLINEIQFWEFHQKCWEERSSLVATGRGTEPRDNRNRDPMLVRYLSPWTQPRLMAAHHWILQSLHSLFDLN